MLLRSLKAWSPLLLVLVSMTAASAQAPNSTAALARYAPKQDLIFLLEFDGLDAHNAAWTRTTTYQLLTKTTLGALLEDLTKQGLNLALASTPASRKPTSTELIDALKRVIRGGFLVALAGKPSEKQASFVFVIRGGAKNGTRALIERLIAPPDAKTPGLQTETRGSRSIVKLLQGDGGIAWWSEKEDLLLTMEPGGIDAVTAVIDGSKPNATTHPIRTELMKSEEGFTPALRLFVDIAALPIPPKQGEATGLSGLKRIDYRWGFQDNMLYSVARLVAPAPRKGLMALLDGPTFDKGTLPPLPPDLHGFTVVSLQPGELFTKFTSVVRTLDPKAGANLDQAMEQFPKQFGFDLKREFLDQLGPRMTFAMKPANPRAPFDLFITAQVKNPATMLKVIDRMTPIANAMLNPRRPGAPAAGGRPATGAAQMRKVTAGIGAGSTWIMDLPAGMVPPNFGGTSLKPTIRVGKSTLVIASRPELAQTLIPLMEANGKKWTFTGDYAALAKRLPGNLVMLSIEDPRDVLPGAIENLPVLAMGLNAAIASSRGPNAAPASITVNPSLVPKAASLLQYLSPSFSAVTTNRDGIALVSRESVPSVSSPASAGVVVALLLPAVQAAREAARRAQCVNNLKQMGLALHNFNSATDAFPAAAITDKSGKPLLSWRVAILPYIEQQHLYAQFHLDEPWDSPHNKALLPLMPATYACPSRVLVPGQTNYRGFAGNGAFWDLKKPGRIQEITDGTSFTLMVVEAADGVPWTKPEEIEFNPEAATKLFGAGSMHPGGFNALMGDGSVRFIKATINSVTLRALITKQGGEVINVGAF